MEKEQVKNVDCELKPRKVIKAKTDSKKKRFKINEFFLTGKPEKRNETTP